MPGDVIILHNMCTKNDEWFLTYGVRWMDGWMDRQTDGKSGI